MFRLARVPGRPVFRLPHALVAPRPGAGYRLQRLGRTAAQTL